MPQHLSPLPPPQKKSFNCYLLKILIGCYSCLNSQLCSILRWLFLHLWILNIQTMSLRLCIIPYLTLHVSDPWQSDKGTVLDTSNYFLNLHSFLKIAVSDTWTFICIKHAYLNPSDIASKWVTCAVSVCLDTFRVPAVTIIASGATMLSSFCLLLLDWVNGVHATSSMKFVCGRLLLYSSEVIVLSSLTKCVSVCVSQLFEASVTK